MSRAFLVVMDSVGIGGALDAAAFGDEGSDTLGHIAAECAAGRANEGRNGPLRLPNLDALGLGRAAELATGTYPPGFSSTPTGPYAAANEVSNGKDTPSGHWELAGMPVPFDWHYFPDTQPAFPQDKIAEMIARAGLPGILGDCHASGTKIIEELGEEHVKTGKPIVYTSADSVVQIAAHEQAFGLGKLYALCEIAAELFHPMMVGRVIARPFLGADAASFKRTPNRHDYAITPPEKTLCNRVVDAGGRALAIGKIGDIFAMSGISEVFKGKDDMALFDHLLTLADTAQDGDLVFANFVEFDSEYGHRRDVPGYARALETFDARIPALLKKMRKDDLLIITADHGNDPTWHGTEHTRERVPVLVHGAGLEPGPLGQVGFVQVGETLAAHLGLAQGKHGRSFL
ncbi:phosphopentomutase [Abyssibius alkaniclasticus]|uniref:phosphopentomutase n=1 Tax=Abyssibius alkaniclasticus TaxID=2881234 RepID=UPI0040594AC7